MNLNDKESNNICMKQFIGKINFCISVYGSERCNIYNCLTGSGIDKD